MKSSHVASVMLALLVSAVGAESPAMKEFERLNEQRDKAMAEAIKPVNDRYVTALEAMLQRTIKSGDLDAANRMRTALDYAKGELTPASVLGRWSQKAPDGQQSTLILEENGKATFVTSDGKSFPNVWKIEGKKLIVGTTDNRFFISYSQEGTSLAGTSSDGTKGFTAKKEW